MRAPKLTAIHTHEPVRVALEIMGTGAKAAAKTWTIQEWAGSLAAKAGPRDYVGQLRELYNGVISRWRYVMENGERVPESPAAILGYVLGANYNQGKTCPSPERCDVARTEWKHKGWGDCDDVSTLIASAVLALGMQPLLRVAVWPGGGHVSVVTRTPRGQWVSIDPVGHPEEKFGWAMAPDGGQVLFFNLDAQEVQGPRTPFVTGSPMGVLAHQAGPFLQGVDGVRTYAQNPGHARVVQENMGPTFMLSPQGVPRSVIQKSHVALVRPGDTRGRRVLTLPRYHARMFARGLISDRAPAIDQFGEAYEYLGGIDAWAPMGEWQYDGVNDGRYCKYLSGLGRKRFRRKRTRAERKARRRKFYKRAGKKFRKVFKFSLRMAARVLDSRVAKRTIGSLLGVFGIPQEAVNGIFAGAAASLRETGKITKFVRYMLTGRWKQAAKIARAVARVGGRGIARGVMPEGVPGFSGADVPAHPIARTMWGMMDADEDDREADRHWCMQSANGREYAVAPVMGMRMGEPKEIADIATRVVLPTPTPGGFYRVVKGDTPLGVAGRAFGLKAGSARTKALKRMQAISYNEKFLRPAKTDFEKKYIGDNVLSFRPSFACDPMDQYKGQSGGCYPVIWVPQADEEPPEYTDVVAPPVLPTLEPEVPPVKVPVEPAPTTDDTPEGLPEMPAGKCPEGFMYKLTPAFIAKGGAKVPAGWTCVADPDYVPSKPAPPKVEEVKPEPTPDEPERPQTKEPPSPGLPPDVDWSEGVPPEVKPKPRIPGLPSGPTDLPPGLREPMCPPGLVATWPSGQPGFGPHECRDPDAPEPWVPPSQPAAPGEGGGGAIAALGVALALLSMM